MSIPTGLLVTHMFIWPLTNIIRMYDPHNKLWAMLCFITSSQGKFQKLQNKKDISIFLFKNRNTEWTGSIKNIKIRWESIIQNKWGKKLRHLICHQTRAQTLENSPTANYSETAWGRAAKRIKENTFCIPEIEHQSQNGRLQGSFNVCFCSLWNCQPAFLIFPTPFLIQCLAQLSGVWNASGCLELYGTGVHSYMCKHVFPIAREREIPGLLPVTQKPAAW